MKHNEGDIAKLLENLILKEGVFGFFELKSLNFWIKMEKNAPKSAIF
jgi:hypothetical protein